MAYNFAQFFGPGYNFQAKRRSRYREKKTTGKFLSRKVLSFGKSGDRSGGKVLNGQL